MQKERVLGGFAVIAIAAALGCARPAAAGPEIAIGPYVMQPTPTSMTICWVSDAETTGGSVQWGPASARLARTTPESGPKTRYHRVTLTGLKPYTRYSYSVVAGGDRSAPATFITAAGPSQTAFHFVAYGDNRTQADRHAAVTARVRAFHPDFLLQSGDMVADGRNEDQWAVFWKIAQPLYSESPVFPALGNHERNGAPYYKYFAVPEEYSFDYGNAHFVALDSNRPEDEWPAQEKWLRDDLAAHQKATWRIVFFHHTPLTCVAMPDRRANAVILRKRLEPIFEQGDVQLVINGHDHTYQRHVAPDGIYYVVSGGGGAPLYQVVKDTPYVKVAESTYNDCEVTVTGKTLAVRAVRPDGTLIDQFALTAK